MPAWSSTQSALVGDGRESSKDMATPWTGSGQVLAKSGAELVVEGVAGIAGDHIHAGKITQPQEDVSDEIEGLVRRALGLHAGWATRPDPSLGIDAQLPREGEGPFVQRGSSPKEPAAVDIGPGEVSLGSEGQVHLQVDEGPRPHDSREILESTPPDFRSVRASAGRSDLSINSTESTMNSCVVPS